MKLQIKTKPACNSCFRMLIELTQEISVQKNRRIGGEKNGRGIRAFITLQPMGNHQGFHFIWKDKVTATQRALLQSHSREGRLLTDECFFVDEFSDCQDQEGTKGRSRKQLTEKSQISKLSWCILSALVNWKQIPKQIPSGYLKPQTLKLVAASLQLINFNRKKNNIMLQCMVTETVFQVCCLL